MVGNSGRDHDQKSKSDSTGYPSHSLVSTRRDDPREMRDAQNASEDKLCGLSFFQPKTFAHASRIREAYLSKESSDLPPHPALKNETKKA
jgi:hypothetical protein